MTHDFAKKPRQHNRRNGYQSRVPGWVWLFTGSVLGAFVMFLVYLTGITPQPTQFPALGFDEQTETPALKPSEETTIQEPETSNPRFDFYQLLKESEVAKVEPPDTTTPLVAGPQYTLQVGSFRNLEDADRLRAKLILMNMEARIETVTVRNAETWHRVLVGPYTTRAQLAKARGTLAANSLDSLVLRNTEPRQDG